MVAEQRLQIYGKTTKMASQREERVPTWDGQEATFDIFATECHQYVDTVEYKKR